MLADRQTDTHTHTNTQTDRQTGRNIPLPYRGGVITTATVTNKFGLAFPGFRIFCLEASACKQSLSSALNTVY